MKNSRGQQVSYDLATAHPNGVPGIVASLHAANQIGILSQQIYKFAFAFIAELSSKNAGGFAGVKQGTHEQNSSGLNGKAAR
jgi:hypothetical protein